MMVAKTFSVIIGATDITDSVVSASASLSASRPYATGTIIMSDDIADPILSVGTNVILNFNNISVNGYVFDAEKNGENEYRVSIRSNVSKLFEPFSASESVVEPSTTSHALFAQYESDTGVTIDYTTTADIDFGGSYERNSSVGAAIQAVANITGAEVYEDGGDLVVTPNRPVSGTAAVTQISEDDIFDFVGKTATVYNKGVGYVTIVNGGSVTDDIVSKNLIYAEIDECSGRLEVYPNPAAPIEYIKGGSVDGALLTKGRTQEITVTDAMFLTVNGAIESVQSVKLNGTAITDSHFEQGHNIIWFDSSKRGVVSVSYQAYYQPGQASVTQTPMGRFVSLDIFYLDQVLIFQGFLSCDAFGGMGVGSDGAMTCIVPRDMMYPRGFDVWTIGGTPSLKFYNGSTEISYTPTTTSADYISVEEARLQPASGGAYRYYVQYPLTTALDARSAGTTVTYTTGSDATGAYFEFSQYYPALKVSYKTAAKKHTVQFADIANADVRMLIINTDDDEVCEYKLNGVDHDNIDYVPCELNTAVPIDIAQQTGLPISDIAGTTLSYTDPSGTAGTTTIDNMGIAKITPDQNGDYTIDISGLTAGTQHSEVRRIVLKVNVNTGP